MQLITKRRMSLHAVAADDVWLAHYHWHRRPTPSLPIVSLVVQSSFQKTAAHPPSSSIVSCNFRYIESTDGSVGERRQRFPKNAARRSRSLWLCSIYTLSTPDWESFTSGGGNGHSSAPPMYSGQFSPNSSSISLRLSSADQLLTAHSTLERTPSAIPMKAVGSP